MTTVRFNASTPLQVSTSVRTIATLPFQESTRVVFCATAPMDVGGHISGFRSMLAFWMGGASCVPALPSPDNDIGGMVKKRRRRFTVTIDGRELVANSLPELQQRVAAYRDSHPEARAAPVKVVAKVKPVRRTRPDPEAPRPRFVPKAVPLRVVELPTLFPGLSTAVARLKFEEMDRIARQHAADEAAAIAKAFAEDEDDDMEIIMHILKMLK